MRKSNRNKSEYMRNRILFAISICFCFVVSSAQECDNTLETARFYKNKGNYEKAVRYYQDLNKNCPNYVSAKVKEEWNYCKQQLNQSQNKPIPAIPSGQHVEKKPQPGSPTSPETTLGQYGRVKVSFDAGKATPFCENIQSIIKQLENDENLELKIEIPWCRDLYSLQLIEKRIRNITEIFIAAGIEETIISSDITLVEVLDGFDNFTDICNDDQFSKHVILINADEGYNACDSAWLKTADLSDALSKTKILFDFGEDVPKISDYNANICKTVKILNKNSKLKLVVEGFISSDEDRNLAQRRANRVRDMFIQLGVNSDQIETAAYMVEDPRNRQNTTDLSRKEHRASIFRIVKREPQNIKILFDYDKDIPKISDYKAVDEHVDFLKNQSTYKLIVEGYTCDQGPEEHNRDLAQRRANNVRELFIEKGVDPSLIETASYTVNDPQNRQNITNQNECDFAICRIVKR